MERHLSSLEKICQAVGDVVDIIRLGDDLGMSTGPMMSPETYRHSSNPVIPCYASTSKPTAACTPSSTPAARSTS